MDSLYIYLSSEYFPRCLQCRITLLLFLLLFGGLLIELEGVWTKKDWIFYYWIKRVTHVIMIEIKSKNLVSAEANDIV